MDSAAPAVSGSERRARGRGAWPLCIKQLEKNQIFSSAAAYTPRQAALSRLRAGGLGLDFVVNYGVFYTPAGFTRFEKQLRRFSSYLTI